MKKFSSGALSKEKRLYKNKHIVIVKLQGLNMTIWLSGLAMQH